MKELPYELQLEAIRKELTELNNFITRLTINYRDLEVKLENARMFFDKQENAIDKVIQCTIKVLVDKISEKSDY